VNQRIRRAEIDRNVVGKDACDCRQHTLNYPFDPAWPIALTIG
jgi:hypothetical protein